MIPTRRPVQISPKCNAGWGRALQKRRKIWRAPFLPHKVLDTSWRHQTGVWLPSPLPFVSVEKMISRWVSHNSRGSRQWAALSIVWEESVPEPKLRAGVCLPLVLRDPGWKNFLCSSAYPGAGGSILCWLHLQEQPDTFRFHWGITANNQRKVWAIKC